MNIVFLLTGSTDTYPRIGRTCNRFTTHPITTQIIYNTCECCVPPLRNCYIFQRYNKVWFEGANCWEEEILVKVMQAIVTLHQKRKETTTQHQMCWNVNNKNLRWKFRKQVVSACSISKLLSFQPRGDFWQIECNILSLATFLWLFLLVVVVKIQENIVKRSEIVYSLVATSNFHITRTHV